MKETKGAMNNAGFERTDCGNGGWHGQATKGETVYFGGKALLRALCGRLASIVSGTLPSAGRAIPKVALSYIPVGLP